MRITDLQAAPSMPWLEPLGSPAPVVPGRSRGRAFDQRNVNPASDVEGLDVELGVLPPGFVLNAV